MVALLLNIFKAANPGCVLADFVRWHSPRDWEEENGLSARMRANGNMWQVCLIKIFIMN